MTRRACCDMVVRHAKNDERRNRQLVLSHADISRIGQGWPQPNPAYVAAPVKALAVDVDTLTRRSPFLSVPKDARVVVWRRRR
jgi:hypothetical protein